MTIGDLIKQFRESKGIDSQVFAKSLAISREWLSKIENGKVTPSSKTLKALHVKYDVDFTSQCELLDDEKLNKTEKKLDNIKESISVKKDNSDMALQTIYSLSESNSRLAKSHETLADNNSRLIALLEEREKRAIAAADSEIPIGVAAKFEDLLEAVSILVLDKDIRSREEASAVLRRHFYGKPQNKRVADIQAG